MTGRKSGKTVRVYGNSDDAAAARAALRGALAALTALKGRYGDAIVSKQAYQECRVSREIPYREMKYLLQKLFYNYCVVRKDREFNEVLPVEPAALAAVQRVTVDLERLALELVAVGQPLDRRTVNALVDNAWWYSLATDRLLPVRKLAADPSTRKLFIDRLSASLFNSTNRGMISSDLLSELVNLQLIEQLVKKLYRRYPKFVNDIPDPGYNEVAATILDGISRTFTKARYKGGITLAEVLERARHHAHDSTPAGREMFRLYINHARTYLAFRGEKLAAEWQSRLLGVLEEVVTIYSDTSKPAEFRKRLMVELVITAREMAGITCIDPPDAERLARLMAAMEAVREKDPSSDFRDSTRKSYVDEAVTLLASLSQSVPEQERINGVESLLAEIERASSLKEGLCLRLLRVAGVDAALEPVVTHCTKHRGYLHGSSSVASITRLSLSNGESPVPRVIEAAVRSFQRQGKDISELSAFLAHIGAIRRDLVPLEPLFTSVILTSDSSDIDKAEAKRLLAFMKNSRDEKWRPVGSSKFCN